ncbi:hypothetical protein J2X01_000311 [Arthrobacter ginsengisoli]|uniref:Uncharacterized protein n=1 Tax=Arthrobacter ginsengisoli TaxID=1356565 RepID=A0ABU1U779_9MICC|nr:hypothetical protein [Arthrobacter ginsengisoli]
MPATVVTADVITMPVQPGRAAPVERLHAGGIAVSGSSLRHR